jgi:hypothetical protein
LMSSGMILEETFSTRTGASAMLSTSSGQSFYQAQPTVQCWK